MRRLVIAIAAMVVAGGCTSSTSSGPSSTTTTGELPGSTVVVPTTSIAVDTALTAPAEVGETRSDTFFTILPSAPAGEDFYTPPPDLPGITGDVIWATEVAPVEDARAFQVLYRSQTVDGVPTAVSGLIFVPASAPPDGGFPIVGWAPERTGLADACAVSRGSQPSDSIPLLLELLRGGYVVASTDYEGLGTPGEHPFGVAAAEARALLDAVRAAQQFIGGGNEVFLVGEGQGGHAALAASEHAPRYAPELPIRGVVAAGATVFASNAELVSALASTPLKGLIVMSGVGQTTAFGPVEAPPQRWFTDLGIAFAELTKDFCVDEYLARFSAVAAEDLFVEGAPAPFTSGSQRRFEVSIGNSAGSAPTFLLQGRLDLLTAAAVIPPWVNRACEAGHRIELVWMDSGSRVLREAPETSHPLVLNWLGERLAGIAPVGGCVAIPGPND